MIRPTYRITALNQTCATQKPQSAKLININFSRAANVLSILFHYGLEQILEQDI